MSDNISDIFVIGGGINGTGIARDAQGRGLKVTLAEMNDLASATSSASTKLFHGGLRYLEYFEVDLVRKALIERETLLTAMPHISWPMRFVLPYHKDMRFETTTPASRLLNRFMPWMKGRRPAWMIRIGLFFYDHLGGRKILPATKTLNLETDPVGEPLDDRFLRAFEYSDCWVEDSRLVVLNARDAEERGATILVRTKVLSARREGDLWVIETENQMTGARDTHMARSIVNAGGPWVEEIVKGVAGLNSSEGIRLVQGSHIVTRSLFDHGKCYFFQGQDGRIIFAIPYETDFTLIGTTDREFDGNPSDAKCTAAEADYLIDFANQYFKRDISRDDIVWTYSGVRPLYDDGAKSATAATRDYVLSLDTNGAPILSVFGGKITTYRKLAEQAFEKLAPHFPEAGKNWTARVPLPGGDFAVDAFDDLVAQLAAEYPFLDEAWARRMVRAYGTDAWNILGDAEMRDELGGNFGATLTSAEVHWLMSKEYARTADDIVWRRSKLGLRMSKSDIEMLDEIINSTLPDLIN
ncbi:MAG: glycerol-3-phosphate dehydrogenase [Boseongicola sp.]|nr:glycerol-3-phosphate dehydrogenase [Boseongicola sp.]MDD9976708.1 glycerol-3-phosphate dehydrogenase [Boseongicola sp.]